MVQEKLYNQGSKRKCYSPSIRFTYIIERELSVEVNQQFPICCSVLQPFGCQTVPMTLLSSCFGKPVLVIEMHRFHRLESCILNEELSAQEPLSA